MKKIKRRDFIKSIGVSLVGGSILASNVGSSDVKTQFKWKMVTSWPKNFPGLGVGAENLAKIINQLSNNRIKVKVFGANELVPHWKFLTLLQGVEQNLDIQVHIIGKERVRHANSFHQFHLV